MKRGTIIGFLFIVLMAVLLSGCGGGGGGGAQQSVGGEKKSGKAPVSGATVFADKQQSGNRFEKDADEVSGTTDANGNYRLSIPDGYGDFEFISQGGTDTLFNRAAIQMRAPSDARNISPLTTLVAADPALQPVVQPRIESLGVAYDDDINAGVTGALFFARSVEAVVTALSSSLAQAYNLTEEEKYDIQDRIFAATAAQLAAPGTTTDMLLTPASLKTLLSAAVVSAMNDIEAAYSNISTDNEAQLATIIVGVVDMVATAVGPPFSAEPAAQKSDAPIFDPNDAAAINTAIDDAAKAALTLYAADTTAPTIIYRSPTPDATGVALNVNVLVGFSEPMDRDTINGTNIFLKKTDTGELIPASVSYSSRTRRATLNPRNDLLPDTTYTVTVTTDVADRRGNHLAVEDSWNFTTLHVDLPPTIIYRSPSPGATGVALNDICICDFSEAMDPNTINTSTVRMERKWTGQRITCVVSYDPTTMRCTCAPVSNLRPNTAYTVTVTTGVADLAGTHMARRSRWDFRTGSITGTGTGGEGGGVDIGE